VKYEAGNLVTGTTKIPETRRVLPEADWIESRRHGAALGLGIVACFGLGGRNSADRFEQAPAVEPIHPFQHGEFDVFQASPRSVAPDRFGLVEAVDGLGLTKKAFESSFECITIMITSSRSAAPLSGATSTGLIPTLLTN
jgi:hypothetical protein